MRILIVEDEVKIREGMSKLIQKHTSHTIAGEAKNGKEGLELILRYKPDFIITDIRMPDMDGLEMLTALYATGFHPHAAILSGYSEFEYAKKAIHLGVDDYLLKPVGAEEVVSLLERVSQQLKEEEAGQNGKTESLLRDILLGSIENSISSYPSLKKLCGFCDTMNYGVFAGYLGSAPPDYKNRFQEIFPCITKKYPSAFFYIITMDSLQQIICLAAGEFSPSLLCQAFERKVMQPLYQKGGSALWSFSSLNQIEEFRITVELLQKQFAYGLSMGNQRILTRQDVEHFLPGDYNYPSHMESALKSSICSGNYEQTGELSRQFTEYIRAQHYSPQNIKHAYQKMLTFLVNIFYEIDQKLYEQAQSFNVLDRINNACLLSELEVVFRDILLLLKNGREGKEDIRNYTIRRAINYIREHYQEGITLEEVARKLEITPEYLSTLFNKEMKLTFSVFLKQFRISHAKRLLKGTDLKIYEIAEQIGYHDSKYFIRVFKEEQGVSPGEYRQLN